MIIDFTMQSNPENKKGKCYTIVGRSQEGDKKVLKVNFRFFKTAISFFAAAQAGRWEIMK